jgi:pantoate--beta-alanine ligase
MIRTHTRAELQAALAPFREAGERIGFVPTMGALHAGHLALVERARKECDRVVVSIFVNPTQFGPHEDYHRYPRTPEADCALLSEQGCDVVFLPDVETIYPPGHATRVHVEGAALGFEGEIRPGHFDGVATVVTILFGLVKPQVAYFGEKDAQQLAVVEQLVRDLVLPVTIRSVPTVRDHDGLALSSRNVYLSPKERELALALPRGLDAAAQAFLLGEHNAMELEERVRREIVQVPGLELEYVALVDAKTFQPVPKVSGEVVLAAAVRIGSVRLLDNRRFTYPEEKP